MLQRCLREFCIHNVERFYQSGASERRRRELAERRLFSAGDKLSHFPSVRPSVCPSRPFQYVSQERIDGFLKFLVCMIDNGSAEM